MIEHYKDIIIVDSDAEPLYTGIKVDISVDLDTEYQFCGLYISECGNYIFDIDEKFAYLYLDDLKLKNGCEEYVEMLYKYLVYSRNVKINKLLNDL
jgi:hypothetical protein